MKKLILFLTLLTVFSADSNIILAQKSDRVDIETLYEHVLNAVESKEFQNKKERDKELIKQGVCLLIKEIEGENKGPKGGVNFLSKGKFYSEKQVLKVILITLAAVFIGVGFASFGVLYLASLSGESLLNELKRLASSGVKITPGLID